MNKAARTRPKRGECCPGPQMFAVLVVDTFMRHKTARLNTSLIRKRMASLTSNPAKRTTRTTRTRRRRRRTKDRMKRTMTTMTRNKTMKRTMKSKMKTSPSPSRLPSQHEDLVGPRNQRLKQSPRTVKPRTAPTATVNLQAKTKRLLKRRVDKTMMTRCL